MEKEESQSSILREGEKIRRKGCRPQQEVAQKFPEGGTGH